MSRPSSGTVLAAAGLAAAVGTALIAVGGIELASRPHPDIWSNSWIRIGLVVIGLGAALALALSSLNFFARRNNDNPKTAVQLSELVDVLPQGRLPRVAQLDPYTLGATSSLFGNASTYGQRDDYVPRWGLRCAQAD